MKGTILTSGVISADDGNRYSYDNEDFNGRKIPSNGDEVEFVIEDGKLKFLEDKMEEEKKTKIDSEKTNKVFDFLKKDIKIKGAEKGLEATKKGLEISKKGLKASKKGLIFFKMTWFTNMIMNLVEVLIPVFFIIACIVIYYRAFDLIAILVYHTTYRLSPLQEIYIFVLSVITSVITVSFWTYLILVLKDIKDSLRKISQNKENT